MKNMRLSLLLALLLSSMAQIHAQASLSFQGALQKASGANFDDGEYAMTFRLYESETGGSAVWSETQDAVDVLGGVFNTLLGTVNPLNAAFDKTYFLGISVNYGVEMVPRIRLTASPYSLSLIGQNNIFPSTGAVGAGTAAPDNAALMHVKKAGGTGRVLAEGSDTSMITLQKGGQSSGIFYDGSKITISNLDFNITGNVAIPAGQTVKYGNLNDWRLVDVDDFSTGNDGWVCHDSWLSTTTKTFQRFSPGTPLSEGYILRPNQSGGDALKKQFDLTGIPHTMVKVVFTYHLFDTWLNEVGFAGFATSSNPWDASNKGSGFFQIGWHWTRGDGINHLRGAGYTAFFDAGGATDGFAQDYNVRDEMVAQCTDDKFWIIFCSSLDEAPSNESFGISNIQIWVK